MKKATVSRGASERGGLGDVKIVVATHKEYPMPEDKMYLPVFSGSALAGSGVPAGYRRDDEGENISEKNPGFSELTALYWAWKNLSADYIGLVHYRRYFAVSGAFKTSGVGASGGKEGRLAKVLSSAEAEEILGKTEVILPKERNYFIENLYDHYVHTMYAEPLEITGEIIQERFPEYHKEFLNLHKRKKAHMFNMFIMKREVLDEYCTWLFAVLFELEERVLARGLKYDKFHARFYGRVSELLLDVFLRTRGIKYKEVRAVSIEPVNWAKKGTKFLSAKMLGKKYEESF